MATPPPIPPQPAPLSETDLSGRRLGDFHLLRRLGRGAMAEVYLAEQGRLKRRVAVKILKPDLAGDRTVSPAVPVGSPGRGFAGARQHRADL